MTITSLIPAIIKKLGFHPNLRDPAYCWPWPGTLLYPKTRYGDLRGRAPVIKHAGKTHSVRRPLVQYVNPHQKLESYHRVSPCPEHTLCVNPFHQRVKATKAWAPFY